MRGAACLDGGGGLPREPFLQARAAEGVQAVEQRQGLVHDVCTYLAAC